MLYKSGWRVGAFIARIPASDRRPDLSQMLQQRYTRRSSGHRSPKVTVTAGKYRLQEAARSKAALHARMCKGISHVRGLRGRLQVRSQAPARGPRRRKAGTVRNTLAARNVKRNEWLEGICGGRRQRQLGFLRNFRSERYGTYGVTIASGNTLTVPYTTHTRVFTHTLKPRPCRPRLNCFSAACQARLGGARVAFFI